MTRKHTGTAKPAELRRRAEQQVSGTCDGAPTTAEERERLLHELQVHRVELEMRNEDLRRTSSESSSMSCNDGRA